MTAARAFSHRVTGSAVCLGWLVPGEEVLASEVGGQEGHGGRHHPHGARQALGGLGLAEARRLQLLQRAQGGEEEERVREGPGQPQEACRRLLLPSKKTCA